MILCPLLSILHTRKASDASFVFGEDLISFAISDTVERSGRGPDHAVEIELRHASYADLHPT